MRSIEPLQKRRRHCKPCRNGRSLRVEKQWNRTTIFGFTFQNPIEQEGTYPLPEAQLDRFMFSVVVGYPTEEEELAIVSQTTVGKDAEITPVLQQDELICYQKLLRQLPTSDNLMRLCRSLGRASRPDTTTISAIKEFVHWGAGPRASSFLVVAAKVRAAHGHSSQALRMFRRLHLSSCVIEWFAILRRKPKMSLLK